MSAGGGRSRRSETSPRPRGGIKLRNPVPAPVGPVARRWLQLLEAVIPFGEREAGLEYARRGQVAGLELATGRLEARVSERAATSQRVCWQVSRFPEDRWRSVVNAMATEALYAAKLLAGEFPPAVEAIFATYDLDPVPAPDEVTLECDCATAGPCRHAAAVGFVAVELLDEDPLAILRLRGGADLLERLAAARAEQSHGQAAYADPIAPGEPAVVSLESGLDRFWRPGPELAQLREMPPPQHARHALLRRLGPSPLEGRFPLIGLLASIYDTVSKAALRLRDRGEGI